MILIQFPDRDTEIKGLTVLMSRHSGKVLRGGLHIVPEPALEALTAGNIPYTFSTLSSSAPNPRSSHSRLHVCAASNARPCARSRVI